MSRIWRQQLVPVWRDAAGRHCQQTLNTQANVAADLGGLAAVLDAAEAISVAGIHACGFRRYTLPGHAATSGTYPSVSDKAVFFLRSSAGTTGKIAVPGPEASIFLASTDRVDLSNPLVIAFLDTVFANLGDSNGNAWVLCTQAYRDKTKLGLPLFPETP